MLRKDYAHQKKLQIKIASQQKELGILNSLLPDDHTEREREPLEEELAPEEKKCAARNRQ